MKYCSLILALLPLSLWGSNFTTEVRAGYFYPASDTMRKIYRNGGIDFELEESIRLYKNLNLWMNFNYFQREGRSLGLKDRTSIHIYPLSLGVKYNFPLIQDFYFYLGAGVSYSWIHIHDHSSFVKERPFKQGVGAVAKSGFLYFFRDRFFIDLFADYYYTRVSGVHRSGVQSTPQDIGGLRTGLGLGISY